MNNKKRAMLIILDGFGEGQPEPTNAIYAAQTPYIDFLRKKYSWSLLEPGGLAVGVLPSQTGGSDVGHNTIGAGCVVRQPVRIIHDAIQDGSFCQNEELLAAIQHVKKHKSKLHLMGIGSDSMIHSYIPFITAILDLCQSQDLKGDDVLLHLWSDGRDNPPQSAIQFFEKILKHSASIGVGQLASIAGRFYLDRGGAWERTEKLYQLLTDQNQKFLPAENWQAYIKQQYSEGITDEFLRPQAFGSADGIYPRIQAGDAVINFCYRADRQRQLTAALVANDFTEFPREKLNDLYYVGMIPYSPSLKAARAAFQEEQAQTCLSEVLDKAGLRQCHIAGQEKIIFLTYNLNRCRELHLNTETDICAPQTKQVETFDLNPEMSAPNITQTICDELGRDEYDVYIVNYENCDQVGHTGDLAAAILAVEAVDASLKSVIEKALEHGFEILITADHGNVDVMRDADGNPQTAHSANQVPAILVSDQRSVSLRAGELSDIAPTMLDLLEIEKPAEMTGESLIT